LASDADVKPGDRLARGLAELLAGFVGRARETLLDVAQDPDVDPAMAAAATVAAATAGLLAGEPRAVAEIDQGAAMAETSGLGWLARVARYARLLPRRNPTPEQLDEIRDARRVAGSNGDLWGETLAQLTEGIVLMGVPGEAVRSLERGAAGARRLGAGSIEAWAASLEALASARLGISDARELALRAESLTRSAGVAGARVAVYAALALCDPDHAEEHQALAAATARETGLRLGWVTESPAATESAAGSAAAEPSASGHSTAELPATDSSVAHRPAHHSAADEGAAAVEICLLGGFAMAIGGRSLDLGSVKPRPRAILRFLALNAGQPVHREVLGTTFWPDADPATAARNVHVALSGLRRLLCPSGDADCQILVREGEAYRLALPDGSRVDLLEVERALAEAEAAQGIGDADAARSLRREAIRLGTRELLPEDGPADWVVYRREQLRVELAAAARSVAESLLEADPASAAEVCAVSLRVDATDDGLWRLLIAARERSGDPAAAEGARQAYRRLLEQLGVADRLDPEDVTAGRGTRPR
jgi:LuxR family maltose regulon positive regulatory protein